MNTEQDIEEQERDYQPWDESLQNLVRSNPKAFLALVLPLVLQNAVFKHLLPRKLKTWRLEVDALLQVQVQKKDGTLADMLVHFEFQTYHDSSMRERLLRYNVLLRSEYKLPVLSCVIYLLKDGAVQVSPLVWDLPTDEKVLEFHFGSIELDHFTPEDLLAMGHPELLPLIPVSHRGATPEAVQKMFVRLEELGKTDLLDIGGLLASLVFKRENPGSLDWLYRRLRQMRHLLSEAPLYQEILQEGRQEGLQALRETLLQFVEARFPSRKMLRLAKSQVALIDDPKILRDLILKVGLARTAEKAQQHLINWPDSQETQN